MGGGKRAAGGTRVAARTRVGDGLLLVLLLRDVVDGVRRAIVGLPSLVGLLHLIGLLRGALVGLKLCRLQVLALPLLDGVRARLLPVIGVRHDGLLALVDATGL